MQRKSQKCQKPPKNIGGRPSSYTREIGDLICERVATHELGLTRLCQMYKDMPDQSTIKRWRYQNEEFRTQYAHAKMLQADLLAEECLEIADDNSRDLRVTECGKTIIDNECVARSRLKIDARKWLASKLLPKQYGDRLLLEQKTEENEQLKIELRELRTKLDQKNKKDF